MDRQQRKIILDKKEKICLERLQSFKKALKDGTVSVVVPIDKLSVVITMVFAAIFLHEQFNTKSIIGLVLISVGTLLMVI